MLWPEDRQRLSKFRSSPGRAVSTTIANGRWRSIFSGAISRLNVRNYRTNSPVKIGTNLRQFHRSRRRFKSSRSCVHSSSSRSRCVSQCVKNRPLFTAPPSISSGCCGMEPVRQITREVMVFYPPRTKCEFSESNPNGSRTLQCPARATIYQRRPNARRRSRRDLRRRSFSTSSTGIPSRCASLKSEKSRQMVDRWTPSRRANSACHPLLSRKAISLRNCVALYLRSSARRLWSRL